MFICFLPYSDCRQENLGKKIRQKFFPKNGKRMKTVQNFGNLAVRELPYHLKSFGSLMPGGNVALWLCDIVAL
jgi:hypothetical protein